jgi:hypothetical protein
VQPSPFFRRGSWKIGNGISPTTAKENVQAEGDLTPREVWEERTEVKPIVQARLKKANLPRITKRFAETPESILKSTMITVRGRPLPEKYGG